MPRPHPLTSKVSGGLSIFDPILSQGGGYEDLVPRLSCWGIRDSQRSEKPISINHVTQLYSSHFCWSGWDFSSMHWSWTADISFLSSLSGRPGDRVVCTSWPHDTPTTCKCVVFKYRFNFIPRTPPSYLLLKARVWSGAINTYRSCQHRNSWGSHFLVSAHQMRREVTDHEVQRKSKKVYFCIVSVPDQSIQEWEWD